jgi:hypothetical protein
MQIAQCLYGSERHDMRQARVKCRSALWGGIWAESERGTRARAAECRERVDFSPTDTRGDQAQLCHLRIAPAENTIS